MLKSWAIKLNAMLVKDEYVNIKTTDIFIQESKTKIVSLHVPPFRVPKIIQKVSLGGRCRI